jgi:NarL family two-component system response regulator LiaR
MLDVEMDGPDPFQATDDLRRACPQARVIFLTAHVRDRYLDDAFRCGAWGYLDKGDELDAVVDAIHRVARGEYVFGPRVLERCRIDGLAGRPSLREMAPGAAPLGASRLNTLTRKEVEILRMIGRGMNRTEIARALHRSVKTVDTHRASIMEKLDIHDRTELALFAHKEGLVEA